MSRIVHHNNFNLIRLLAALQVLFVHTLNHLDFKGLLVDLLKVTPGVPMFFVISGFLIGNSYIRTNQRGLNAFFTNRLLRIYPGLVACVLLTTAVVALTGYFNGQGVSATRVFPWVLAQGSFLQFYIPDFMREFGVGVFNGALWTITVELQFYLLVPVLFVLLARQKFTFCCIFIVSVLTNLWVHYGAAPDAMVTKLLRVSFLPWIYMFMFGFMLAWKTEWLKAVQRVGWAPLLLGYTASMVLLGGYETNAQNSINPIAFAFLGCLVLKLAHARLSLNSRVKHLTDQTDLSYGLYLYHMPIINLMLYLGWGTSSLSTAIVVVGSIGTAALSWYLIERPAMNFKR